MSFKKLKYRLDDQLSQKTKRFSSNDSGLLKKSMFIKVLWDGKPIFNQYVDCYTQSRLSNDTIYIIGSMPSGLGWWFNLVLFNDSCFLSSFALSDDKIYKYKAKDKSPISLILLRTLTQNINLGKKPLFREGERINGFVDLESETFFYSSNNSTIKAKVFLSAYFKTAMLQKTN
jgi:hypothetical protein